MNRFRKKRRNSSDCWKGDIEFFEKKIEQLRFVGMMDEIHV